MKTHIRLKIFAVLSLAFLMMNSCTDEFIEINTSRDLLLEDEVNVDMMFTRVMAYICIISNDDGMGTIGNYSGMSVSGGNRPFQDGEASGVWSITYGNYGRNLSDIIRICQERDAKEGTNENVNKIAIARIMKAWAFAKCTDTYGNIPYFESCLPIKDAVYQPKYDSQKDIYTDLFKELKEAVAQLTSSEGSYGKADVLYRGDVEKWRKFANSIRLRLALRVRYVDPAMAKANMSDLSEADLIASRSDDAVINTNSQYTEFMNPQWSDLVERGEIVVKRVIGKTMLDILNNNNDPRTKVFADTAKADWPGTPGYEDIKNFGYRGLPLLGQCPVQQKYPYGEESVSRWSDLLWVEKIEMSLYKASETYFTLAEAALFGIKGSPADAQSFYKKGLEIAMAHTKEFYGSCVPQLPAVIRLFRPGSTDAEIAEQIAAKEITQAQIDDFLANAPVVTLTGSEEEKLEQIINQKMVALFPNEYEGWADYRRTGYPRILVGDDADDLHGKMPRRMPWPTNEQTINGDQYNAALSAIGGVDNRTIRIWWDANPNPIHKHPGTVEWREQTWLK